MTPRRGVRLIDEAERPLMPTSKEHRRLFRTKAAGPPEVVGHKGDHDFAGVVDHGFRAGRIKTGPPTPDSTDAAKAIVMKSVEL